MKSESEPKHCTVTVSWKKVNCSRDLRGTTQSHTQPCVCDSYYSAWTSTCLRQGHPWHSGARQAGSVRWQTASGGSPLQHPGRSQTSGGAPRQGDETWLEQRLDDCKLATRSYNGRVHCLCSQSIFMRLISFLLFHFTSDLCLSVVLEINMKDKQCQYTWNTDNTTTHS